MTESCVQSIYDCIEPEKHKDHEGIIAYLYGRTDG